MMDNYVKEMLIRLEQNPDDESDVLIANLRKKCYDWTKIQGITRNPARKEEVTGFIRDAKYLMEQLASDKGRKRTGICRVPPGMLRESAEKTESQKESIPDAGIDSGEDTIENALEQQEQRKEEARKERIRQIAAIDEKLYREHIEKIAEHVRKKRKKNS